MNLLSPAVVKALFKKYGVRPSKGLGQNFLVDKKTLAKIIAAADIHATDTVVEVGPGVGTLTQELAKKARHVIAIEKDKTMAAILAETLADCNNVEIINADILGYQLPVTDYKVVANLPYYITSPVIRKFLEAPQSPQSMTLMVQKEVAQRICAAPPHMSVLSVSVQFYAAPQIVSYVSKNCFWPAPTVDSAIIKITKHKSQNTKNAVDVQTFFSVVKAGFSSPRKQLVNNLATFSVSNGVSLDKYAATQWLARCGINPNRRAETLAVDEWIALASVL